jgi:hypothetical protein
MVAPDVARICPPPIAATTTSYAGAPTWRSASAKTSAGPKMSRPWAPSNAAMMILSIGVATGDVGSHFQRHHRYPGTHPLAARRFFAFPAAARGARWPSVSALRVRTLR